jgi:hypothetical protein
MEEIVVRVRGQIDQNWSDCLGRLTIVYTENGETTLTGTVRDQSALLGLMNRLGGLGLHILSVTSKETLPPKAQGGSKNVDAKDSDRFSQSRTSERERRKQ